MRTIATADVCELPTERLEAEILTLSGHLAAATATLLAWLAEYDRREGWRHWGCRSCAHWLSWKCGTSLHTAREQVRVARALESLPATAAAFAAGELSYSKARAITRVADADEEERWLHVARHATAAELDRLAGGVRSAIDRSEEDLTNAFDRRTCDRISGTTGLDRFDIRLPRELLEVVWQAIEVEVDRLVDDAAGEGATRAAVIDERGGYAAVRADALVSIARSVLARAESETSDASLGRLQLHIDADVLADDEVVGTCHLNGHRVAPGVARRWACDVTVDPLVIDNGGRARAGGRGGRVVRGRLRRLLHARDHGSCRFPGCTATRWLHAHHIVHWVRGGATELANLVLVCSYHHHLLHEGGWQVALTDEGAEFARPDGRAAAVPMLHGATAGVTERPAHHHIDAQTCQPRWYNDRIDYGYAVSVLMPLRKRDPDVPAGTSGDQGAGVAPTGGGGSVSSCRSTPSGGWSDGGGPATGSAPP